MIEILEKPIQLPLPKPKGKKDGPCYVLAISRNLDHNKGVNNLMRALYMTIDTLVMDENAQVHGMFYIIEIEGSQHGHVEYLEPGNYQEVNEGLEGCVSFTHEADELCEIAWIHECHLLGLQVLYGKEACGPDENSP